MDYAAFVRANSAAFLQSRGIGTDALARLVRAQGFDDAQVLLTSSPVHGIATDTSDIDLICITPQAVNGAQMATQIHHEGHHFEMLPFSSADTRAAFADLARLSRLPLPQRIDGYLRWDSTHAVRRKYLERLVYAVDFSGGTPFMPQLPHAASVVAAMDFDAFHLSHLCGGLAIRAGEGRAAQGYLVNACLALMSTLLSHGGWLLSNKKWIWRRWNAAIAQDMGIIDPALQQRVSGLWDQLVDGHGDAWSLWQQMEDLHTETAALLAVPGIDTLRCQQAAWTRSPMGADAAFIHGDDGLSGLRRIDAQSQPPTSTEALRALPAGPARQWLQAVRSGELSFSRREEAGHAH